MFLQFSAMSGDDVDVIYAQVYTQVPVQIQIRKFEFQPQTQAEGATASVYLVLTNYTILLVGEERLLGRSYKETSLFNKSFRLL